MTPKKLLMSVGLDEHQALLLTTAFDPDCTQDNNDQLWAWAKYCVENVRAMTLIAEVMDGKYLVRMNEEGQFEFQPCNRRRLS